MLSQCLILYNGRRDAHIGKDAEESDDDCGDSNDAEIVRRKQACQHSGYDEGDDDTAIFGKRSVEYAGEKLLFEIVCHEEDYKSKFKTDRYAFSYAFATVLRFICCLAK